MTVSADAMAAEKTPAPAVRQRNEKKPKSARRRAREYALQGIYAWLIQQDDLGAIEAHLREDADFGAADAAWFSTLLHGVPREAETLRAQLAPLGAWRRFCRFRRFYLWGLR